MKKKIFLNLPLLIGGIIVLFLLIIAVMGPQIVPLDPYAMNFHQVIYENGEMIEIIPQMPPNEAYIWGTDVLGRDIFSQIIYGAGITLSVGVFAAIGRFLIAFPFAYFAGYGGKISSRIIDLFNRTFSALPALIIAFIILRFQYIRKLELEPSIFAFTIVLTFIGWGRLGSILTERIKDILTQDFVEGEIAIGKSKFLIAIQNVLPHIVPTIIINFFLEISRTLILIAGLGIFEVYVGANKVPSDTIAKLGLDFSPNYHPEWGGILASSKYAMMVKKPWMALYPALAFFISILGFNLLGEGIKIEVNKRTSKVITYIRKIPYYISPKTFIYEIKHLKENRLPVIIKSSILVGIVIILILGNITPNSIYELDSTAVFSHVEELAKDKYEGRMTGTRGRDKTSEYIVGQMKEYGIEPYFEEGYIKEINTHTSLTQVDKSELYVVDKEGNKLQTFKYREDYSLRALITSKTMSYSERIVGEVLTHEKYLTGDYDEKKYYFLILDNDKLANLQGYAFRNFFTGLRYTENIVGVIYPQRNKESINRKHSIMQAEELYNIKYEAPIMLNTTEEMAKEMIRSKDNKIILESHVAKTDDFIIKNIGGIIKGKNSKKKDRIILTTNYDYFGIDGDTQYKGLVYNGSSVAATLEMTKALASMDVKPENDIIIMFFDASKRTWDTGAKKYLVSDFTIFKDTFAFAVNELGITDSDTLYLDTSYASTNEKKYFEYAKYLKKRAGELGIEVKQGQLINGREHITYIMNGKGRGMLLKSFNDPHHKYFGMEQDDISVIDDKKLTKQAQLILDTVFHIAY